MQFVAVGVSYCYAEQSHKNQSIEYKIKQVQMGPPHLPVVIKRYSKTEIVNKHPKLENCFSHALGIIEGKFYNVKFDNEFRSFIITLWYLFVGLHQLQDLLQNTLKRNIPSFPSECYHSLCLAWVHVHNYVQTNLFGDGRWEMFEL